MGKTERRAEFIPGPSVSLIKETMAGSGERAAEKVLVGEPLPRARRVRRAVMMSNGKKGSADAKDDGFMKRSKRPTNPASHFRLAQILSQFWVVGTKSTDNGPRPIFLFSHPPLPTEFRFRATMPVDINSPSLFSGLGAL